MRIRNSAKAIIIENGRLLCNKNQDGRGIFYCVPGGGQEYQENIRAAVARECEEEIAVQVDVGELLFVRDYIGKNHQGEARLEHVHQVEFFFACQLKEGHTPRIGVEPDKHQIGVEWVPIPELADRNFFPLDLAQWLNRLQHPQRPVYLGDVD